MINIIYANCPCVHKQKRQHFHAKTTVNRQSRHVAGHIPFCGIFLFFKAPCMVNQSSNIFCKSARFFDIVIRIRDIIPRLQFMYAGFFMRKCGLKQNDKMGAKKTWSDSRTNSPCCCLRKVFYIEKNR